jgi:peptidoglycan/LPS O-acetylase OafA/YrhL
MDPGGPLTWAPNASRLGVEMFLVLSGFLITLLLFREADRTGRISLKNFYIRRSLRILPAYGIFLLTIFLFQWLGYVHVAARSWLASLTYTSSIIPVNDWDLGHTWSLSIEEHFYLLWPLCLVLLGKRRAFVACVGWIAAGPLLRVLFDHWLLGPLGGVSVALFTFGQMDCIAVGCALAILATSARFRRLLWMRPMGFTSAFLAAAALLVLSRMVIDRGEHVKWATYYQFFLSPTVHALLLAVLIWCAVNNAGSMVYRLLSWRPLQVVGVLSYSLYLWQQPLVAPGRDGWAFTFPVNVCLLFLVAGLSYLVVESPFLRLRRRFS